MRQSRRMSLVESIANVLIGYVLAVATQAAVFPLFGIHITMVDDLAIGGIFALVSMLRGFILRRIFEALIHQGSLAKCARKAIDCVLIQTNAASKERGGKANGR